MNHHFALRQVEAVRTMLADAALDDDERLILDTLEGETELFPIVAKLLDGIERDEGEAAALKEQMDSRKSRADRAKVRIDTRRTAIAAFMEAAGVTKLPLPEATVTLRTLDAKLAVNQPDAVPDKYTAIKRVPDKALIDAAFTPDTPSLPNWLRIEPARPSITVRRK